ncbi:Anaphase-promoting complex subunit 1 [Gonapodya sp. JEL0774]|nr:Anaphase-promoting complex subunit 1 [Gonapodya sp. JEL0774]
MADYRIFLDSASVEWEPRSKNLFVADSSAATSVFLAHAASGTEIVCILHSSSQTLSMYELSDNGAHGLLLNPLSTFPATSAVPVSATRGCHIYDIAILAPDGSIGLWTGGGNFTLRCTMPDKFMDLIPVRNVATGAISKRRRFETEDEVSESERGSKVARTGKGRADYTAHTAEGVLAAPPSTGESMMSSMVGLLDPCGNRFTVVLSTGVLIRVRATFAPRNPTVGLALWSLSCALPSSSFFLLRAQFLLLANSSRPWRSAGLYGEMNCLAAAVLAASSAKAAAGRGTGWAPAVEGIRSPQAMHAQLAGFRDWELLNERMSNTSGPVEISEQDDWMERVEWAKTFCSGEGLKAELAGHVSDSVDILQDILWALHLVYEDLKITEEAEESRCELGILLVRLSKGLGCREWVDYYTLDGVPGGQGEKSWIHLDMSGVAIRSQFQHAPPSIFSWICNVLRTKRSTPIASQPCHNALSSWLKFASNTILKTSDTSRTPNVINTPTMPLPQFPLIVATKNQPKWNLPNNFYKAGTLIPIFESLSERHFHEVVVQMAMSGWTLAELDRMPPGISVPIREALSRCRKDPPTNWGSAELSLVGRDDLCQMTASSESENTIPHRGMLPNALSKRFALDPSRDRVEEIGIEITDEEIPNLRFGADVRISEVQNMLQSGKSLHQRVDLPVVAESEQQVELQNYLVQLAHRTCALSLGRASLTYATTTHNLLSGPFSFPKLVFSVKVAPLNTVEKLDLTPLPVDMLQWPEFHNGVAAGLRIHPECSGVDASWIIFNRPGDCDEKHAGLLLALGLNGHLRKMVSWHSITYLGNNHELTTIGLLLGLSAAYRGTKNTDVVRLLSVHIPVSHPSHFKDINISPVVQSVSILGMGLLYLNSLHKPMMKRMLIEIGRRELRTVTSETLAANYYHETYSLAAGFALGFMGLGQGLNLRSLEDSEMLHALRRYTGRCQDNGGPDGKPKSPFFVPRESTMTGSYVSKVIEEEGVSVDISAPGALVALALLYLRTDSIEAASKIDIPTTVRLLSYTRPDILLLRVLCRSLILWSSIQPSWQWIVSTIPQFIRDGYAHVKRMTDDGNEDVEIGEQHSQAMQQAFWSCVAGACLAIGLKYAGSADALAKGVLLHCFDIFRRLERKKGMLGNFLSVDHEHSDLNCKIAVSFSDKLNRVLLRSQIDVCAVSLGVVLAGTGDLDTLRCLRQRHGRVELTYGNHMATHMAMGFLFLGGGTATFGTSNEAVAFLLCALFPRYPLNTMDNRGHPQVFRHLWALAVEQRILVTRDVDSGVGVQVPVTLTISADTNGVAVNPKEVQSFVPLSRKLTTPILLPQWDCIQSISVSDPTYKPIHIDFKESTAAVNDLKSGAPLFVERRVGRPEILETLPSSYSTTAGSGSSIVDAGVISPDNWEKYFSADPEVLAFSQHFCDGSEHGSKFRSDSEVDLEMFSRESLLKSLTKDEPDLIGTYLRLYLDQRKILRTVGSGVKYTGMESLAVHSARVVGVLYDVGLSSVLDLIRPFAEASTDFVSARQYLTADEKPLGSLLDRDIALHFNTDITRAARDRQSSASHVQLQDVKREVESVLRTLVPSFLGWGSLAMAISEWSFRVSTSAISASSIGTVKSLSNECTTADAPPGPWDSLDSAEAFTRLPVAFKYIPRIPYATGLRLQEALVKRRTTMMQDAEKMATSGQADLHLLHHELRLQTHSATSSQLPIDIILLVQHDPVYTGGRRIRGSSSSSEGQRLRELTGADYHETQRGGQLTYHGPGQLVGYPILALTAPGGYGYNNELRRKGRPTDPLSQKLPVRCYVSLLEQMMINVAARYGIPAYLTENTGVWVAGTSRVTGKANDENKLGAIGIHLTHNVTSHGFAINCTTDLAYFDQIVACGLPEKGATSIALETPLWAGRGPQLPQGGHMVSTDTSIEAAVPIVVEEIEKVLGRQLLDVDALHNGHWRAGRSEEELMGIEMSIEELNRIINEVLHHVV